MMLHLICCSCCFIRCETGMRLSAVKSKFYSVALVVVVGGDASTGTPPCTAPCTSAQKINSYSCSCSSTRGICVIFAFSSVGKYNPNNFNYSASRSLTQTLRERKN